VFVWDRNDMVPKLYTTRFSKHFLLLSSIHIFYIYIYATLSYEADSNWTCQQFYENFMLAKKEQEIMNFLSNNPRCKERIKIKKDV
jgi:hypothetical protein